MRARAGAIKNLRKGGLAPSFSAGISSLSAGAPLRKNQKVAVRLFHLRTATLDSVSRIYLVMFTVTI
jgi:hypothetical protein